jgi:hypothetical protein
VKVDLATQLDCPADTAWDKIQTSALFLHVIWPLARVVAVEPKQFPPCWREGATLRCRSYIFGVIPIGVRTLTFVRIDQDKREIVTRESDSLVRRWDHVFSITPLGPRRSLHRDTIDIDAGALTFLVWAWASWFYRHRQRRWRALARTL